MVVCVPKCGSEDSEVLFSSLVVYGSSIPSLPSYPATRDLFFFISQTYLNPYTMVL